MPAVFGRTIPKLEVEALTWTLSLATERPLPQAGRGAGRDAGGAAARRAPRACIDPATGTTRTAAIHDRKALAPGMGSPARR